MHMVFRHVENLIKPVKWRVWRCHIRYISPIGLFRKLLLYCSFFCDNCAAVKQFYNIFHFLRTCRNGGVNPAQCPPTP